MARLGARSYSYIKMTAVSGRSRFEELVFGLLRAGHPARFVATGQSMEPAIRDGEPVVVRPVRTAELADGMVVLVASHGRLLAHRIVRLEPDRIHTRGDAVGGEDPPVEPGEVLGRVTAVVRGGEERALGARPESRGIGVNVFRRLVKLGREWISLEERVEE